LVEVTVAIGLCAFVVLGLVGLMSAGLISARTASTDTLLPSLAERVLGDVMARPYGSLSDKAGPYLFTRDGMPADAAEAAFYSCEVKVLPVSAEILPPLLRPDDPSELGRRVRLVFTRPFAPNEAPEIFETAIARH
jgi:hypothetical protein